MIRTIGIAGVGTMGSGIAQVFGQAGYVVLLHDTDPAAIDRGLRAVDGSLAKFVKKGLLSSGDADAARSRLRVVSTLDAFAEADYIVEAVVEDASTKARLFSALDIIARDDVVLASNTSSISIETLAAATRRPDRTLGMHFMNPVPLIPLVELIRARHTTAATVETARELVRAIGKTAVESADRPGFIANRILMPMINEAVHALAEQVGTAIDIDATMTLGMRHPMGPLALADLIGLDVCVAVMDVMRTGLQEEKFAPAPLLRQMVAEGHLGRKTGRGFYSY